MADRAYTNDELDAAVAALTDPARLRSAQELVIRAAPGLQRLLGTALDEGGWFDAGHEQAVREVAQCEDLDERLRELRTLLAEETRLGMMVGVAVGFELAHELEGGSDGLPASGPGAETGGPGTEDQTFNPEED